MPLALSAFQKWRENSRLILLFVSLTTLLTGHPSCTKPAKRVHLLLGLPPSPLSAMAMSSLPTRRLQSRFCSDRIEDTCVRRFTF